MTPTPNTLGRPPAVPIMRNLGLEPDPWQTEVLEGHHPRLLLNCCRQAGKSTVVALLALVEAIWVAQTKVLLLSRSHRQSRELFRVVTRFFRRLTAPMLERQTAEELHLANLSEIVCLPCKEETIRGYSNVSLLIIDEAARVPDDLYRAVSPMLAVSNGRLICLSTPYGKRGFFYDAWSQGGDDWHRIEVPAARIPRIKPDYLERERRTLGESWYRQEFCCSFEALEGLVYPDFHQCVVLGPAPEGKRVGGIDFGFSNPFAAFWGILDANDILWITGEHFSREKSLAHHAQHLPKGYTWYADPSGPREIMELRCAGFTVTAGDNDRRPVAEAALYRYDPDRRNRSEKPLKENDHTMDALRYLVSRIDARRMARIRKGDAPTDPTPAPEKPPRKWLSLYNESLWTGPDDVMTWIVPRPPQ